MQNGDDFDTRHWNAAGRAIFTTHTPVPAGIDRFPRELIVQQFAGWSDLPLDRVLALGAEDYQGGDPSKFNMAVMCFRLAQRANGVSALHGSVSREMFQGCGDPSTPARCRSVPSPTACTISPGCTASCWTCSRRRPRQPLRERWLRLECPDGSRQQDDLGAQAADARGPDRHDPRPAGGQQRKSWHVGGLGRQDAQSRCGHVRLCPAGAVGKRLTLMLRDPARLKALLTDEERPIQIVIAGKAHPADEGGAALIQQMVQFADDPSVREHIVFLPD